MRNVTHTTTTELAELRRKAAALDEIREASLVWDARNLAHPFGEEVRRILARLDDDQERA